MSLPLAGMAFSAFTQYQGIQSQKRAEQARANSLERQSYDEMKRSQLGAQQDHNDRIAQFRDYEESVVLAGGGRNDRSITAITESARDKSVDAHQLGLLVSRLNLPCKVTMPAWTGLMHPLMRAINLSV